MHNFTLSGLYHLCIVGQIGDQLLDTSESESG